MKNNKDRAEIEEEAEQHKDRAEIEEEAESRYRPHPSAWSPMLAM